MGWKQINGKRWIINTVRPKRNKNICLERFVTKVLVTTGRNWKQLKLVKQNAAYLYYIKLLNNKKIQQKNTNYWYNNMDESQNLNGKNQTQKKNILYDSIYIKCKLICRQIVDQWCTRNQGRNGVDVRIKEIFLGVIEISWLWWWFVGIFNCQNSLNCTLRMYAIYSMWIISQ